MGRANSGNRAIVIRPWVMGGMVGLGLGRRTMPMPRHQKRSPEHSSCSTPGLLHVVSCPSTASDPANSTPMLSHAPSCCPVYALFLRIIKINEFYSHSCTQRNSLNRTITTYPSRSSAAATATAAASSPASPIYADGAQHLDPADLHPDDLPIISQDANQVAVGWDTRTWSRLCVAYYLSLIIINHSRTVTTSGCATTAAVQSASIPSPNSASSTLSRQVPIYILPYRAPSDLIPDLRLIPGHALSHTHPHT